MFVDRCDQPGASAHVRGQAPLIDLVKLPLESQLASKTLKDAGTEADNILNKSENATNRVATDAAIRLNILIENLYNALGTDIGKAYSDLSVTEQNAINEVNRIIDDAQSGIDKIEDLETNLDIDMNRTLSRVPFLKAYPISVANVKGIYQVRQDMSYSIVLTGNGFGLNGLSVGNAVDVYVNGQALSASLIVPNSNNQTHLTVPQEFLNQYFVATFPHRVGLFVVVNTKDTKHYRFNLPLVLYPTYSAVLNLSAKIPTDTWAEEPIVPFEFPGQGGDGATMVMNTRSKPYDNDHRVKSILLHLLDGGPGCQHCATPDTVIALSAKPAETYTDVPSEHTIYFRARCNGSVCQLRWEIIFEKRSSTPTDVQVENSRQVEYGVPFDFDLPPGAVDWQLTGRFYSGQAIVCKKGNCGPFAEEKTTVPIGNNQERITIQLKSPYLLRAPRP